MRDLKSSVFQINKGNESYQVRQRVKIIGLVVWFFILMASILLWTGLIDVGYAATNVSGQIIRNTTWTTSDSPYIVTGNVLVKKDVTLTIEPGVVVKFNKDKLLQIDGALIARGTSTNYITFTSNQTDPKKGDWGGIYFSDASVDATFDARSNYTGGSIIQYCVVEYGGGGRSIKGAIWTNKASPFINSSIIRNNDERGIWFNYSDKGTSWISNNTIIQNSTNDSGGGIYADISYGLLNVIGNTISQNSTIASFSYGGGIYAIAAYYSTINLTGNIISQNSSYYSAGGIYGQIYYSTLNITGNSISQNSSRRDAGGILVSGYYDGKVEISSNTIKLNTSDHRGGGIYAVLHDSTMLKISGNSISKNSANEYGGGIFVSSSPYVNINITHNTITSNTFNSNSGDGTGGGIYVDWGYPKINNNNLYDNESYELCNDTSENLDATYNWWGTTDDIVIQEQIYDWADNPDRGVVDYIPYLT